MFGPFFGAALALTVCVASPGVAAAAGTAYGHPAQAKTQATASPRVADLYSLRARRRMATYLRLRLLEWRLAGLDRAAAVVERRLPVDALVPQTAAPGSFAKH